MLQQIGIIIAAFVGFVIAWHIWRTKAQNKKLKCFIGENCDRVVRSRFATTFGVSNEALGMIYYGTLIALYGFAVAGYKLLPHELVLFITGGAVLFSIYLLVIQLFVLREWCEWCIASSILSGLIFAFILFT